MVRYSGIFNERMGRVLGFAASSSRGLVGLGTRGSIVVGCGKMRLEQALGC